MARTANRFALIMALAMLIGMPKAIQVQAATGITDWRISTDYLDTDPTRAGIQDAISSLPFGGVVYVPAGSHPITASIVFPADRPIRLVGAGQNATSLNFQPGVGGDYYIKILGSFQSIEDLTINGSNQSGLQRGIVVDPGSTVLRYFLLKNCIVQNIPNWSLEAINPMPASSASIMSRIEGCTFQYNVGTSGTGLVKIHQNNTTWFIRDSNFGANKNAMLDLDRCNSIRVVNTTFETNDDTQPFIMMFNASAVALTECYFEASAAVVNQFFVKITGGINQSISLTNCQFSRTNQTAARMIQCTTPDKVKSLSVIAPSIYLNTNSAPTGPDIQVTDSTSLVSLVGGSAGTNVDFFTPYVADSAKGSFHANFDKRLRVPRMSRVERNALIGNKAGDVVFNMTESRLNHWDGNRWIHGVGFFPSTLQASAAPGGLTLPTLTTADRNLIPTVFRVEGSIIYNITTHELQYWNGSAWRAVAHNPSP